MARLEAGQPAPDFTLQADDGSTVRRSDLAGQTVALYFYPKDDTTGCTAEACEFRDMRADYDAAGVRVIGVSPDPPKSHGSSATSTTCRSRSSATPTTGSPRPTASGWRSRCTAGSTWASSAARS